MALVIYWIGFGSSKPSLLIAYAEISSDDGSDIEPVSQFHADKDG